MASLHPVRSFALALLLLPLHAQQKVAYAIEVEAPAAQRAAVAATFPSAGIDVLELYLPVWSPGFYSVEDHASMVEELAATGAGGKPLPVEHPRANRWRIATGGSAAISVKYTLLCNRASVTRNQITAEFGVFCGPATFVTAAGGERRGCEVRLALPPAWTDVATGLAPAAGGEPHRFVAPDYDRLCDAPIVAGTIRTEVFDVAGARHELACFGDVGDWDAALAARLLQPVATEICRLFGDVPFQRYVFLNGFRRANGGLEHLDSTLISTSSRTAPDDRGWLAFVAHEYCHAFNVKRLRPVELGPFDYENPPRTPSLWIAEGLTTYVANLACARAGVATPAQWLQSMSSSIRSLQSSPGRKVQTLADASLSVWDGSMSGVGGDPRRTISYYVKGPVVGFLLDARLRVASAGEHGLDTLMRRAYGKWSGERGFTPQEFEALAGELAGADLQPFFDRALRSTEELDYDEALQWFGLRFSPVADDAPRGGRWALEVHPEATAEQRAHLQSLLAPTAAAGR